MLQRIILWQLGILLLLGDGLSWALAPGSMFQSALPNVWISKYPGVLIYSAEFKQIHLQGDRSQSLSELVENPEWMTLDLEKHLLELRQNQNQRQKMREEILAKLDGWGMRFNKNSGRFSLNFEQNHYQLAKKLVHDNHEELFYMIQSLILGGDANLGTEIYYSLRSYYREGYFWSQTGFDTMAYFSLKLHERLRRKELLSWPRLDQKARYSDNNADIAFENVEGQVILTFNNDQTLRYFIDKLKTSNLLFLFDYNPEYPLVLRMPEARYTSFNQELTLLGQDEAIIKRFGVFLDKVSYNRKVMGEHGFQLGTFSLKKLLKSVQVPNASSKKIQLDDRLFHFVEQKPAGAMPGAVYEEKNKRWLIKWGGNLGTIESREPTYSYERSIREVMTAKFIKNFGFNVPAHKLVRGQQGYLYVASEYKPEQLYEFESLRHMNVLDRVDKESLQDLMLLALLTHDLDLFNPVNGNILFEKKGDRYVPFIVDTAEFLNGKRGNMSVFDKEIGQGLRNVLLTSSFFAGYRGFMRNWIWQDVSEQVLYEKARAVDAKLQQKTDATSIASLLENVEIPPLDPDDKNVLENYGEIDYEQSILKKITADFQTVRDVWGKSYRSDVEKNFVPSQMIDIQYTISEQKLSLNFHNTHQMKRVEAWFEQNMPKGSWMRSHSDINKIILLSPLLKRIDQSKSLRESRHIVWDFGSENLKKKFFREVLGHAEFYSGSEWQRNVNELVRRIRFEDSPLLQQIDRMTYIQIDDETKVYLQWVPGQESLLYQMFLQGLLVEETPSGKQNVIQDESTLKGITSKLLLNKGIVVSKTSKVSSSLQLLRQAA